MNLSDYIKIRRAEFEKSSCEYGDLDAHLIKIVEGALGWSPAKIFAESQFELSTEDEAKLNSVVERRLEGEPLQYILGEAWFWKSRFEVGPGVLIPRPETELLVERCLGLGNENRKVAELGAGSGNIGLSVLLERPLWEWHAYEKSPKSAAFAEINRKLILSANHRYFLQVGDFFEMAPEDGPFDLIVSNPPYVAQAEMGTLSEEVQSEPSRALNGGPSGLEIIELLIVAASKLLKPTGQMYLEIGSDQREAVLQLAQSFFAHSEVFPDYSGRSRIFVGHYES